MTGQWIPRSAETIRILVSAALVTGTAVLASTWSAPVFVAPVVIDAAAVSPTMQTRLRDPAFLRAAVDRDPSLADVAGRVESRLFAPDHQRERGGEVRHRLELAMLPTGALAIAYPSVRPEVAIRLPRVVASALVTDPGAVRIMDVTRDELAPGPGAMAAVFVAVAACLAFVRNSR